jgi:hypothetical protein
MAAGYRYIGRMQDSGITGVKGKLRRWMFTIQALIEYEDSSHHFNARVFLQ